MNKSLILILIISGIIVLSILGIGLIISLSAPQEVTTTTITTTTTTSSTSTTTSLKISTTSIKTDSSTTIGNIPQKFNVILKNEKLYKGDNLNIVVMSDSGISGVAVYLNNNLMGYTGSNREYQIRNLEPGDYKLKVTKEGYTDKIVNFSVQISAYGMSSDVRRVLTENERQDIIANGMVNMRFYERPNCSKCIIMMPRMSEVAGKYRKCLVYEFISLWKPGGREDLKKEFPDYTSIDTPVIMIDGPNRRYQLIGEVIPTSELIDMVKNAGVKCDEYD